MNEVDYESLRFIRVFTPLHVPKELIEQVRDRCFEVDDWYAYQHEMCTTEGPNGPVLNPYSLLYVIADEGNKVVGMLWCEIQALSKTLYVQTFSMDKKYWCRGRAVNLAAEKAKDIARDCNLTKISWFTTYPKHSERYGFKRSKSILMEYTEKDDGKTSYGKLEANGASSVDDPGAATSAESDDRGIGSRSESGAIPALSGV